MVNIFESLNQYGCTKLENLTTNTLGYIQIHTWIAHPHTHMDGGHKFQFFCSGSKGNALNNNKFDFRKWIRGTLKQSLFHGAFFLFGFVFLIMLLLLLLIWSICICGVLSVYKRYKMRYHDWCVYTASTSHNPCVHRICDAYTWICLHIC